MRAGSGQTLRQMTLAMHALLVTIKHPLRHRLASRQARQMCESELKLRRLNNDHVGSLEWDWVRSIMENAQQSTSPNDRTPSGQVRISKLHTDSGCAEASAKMHISSSCTFAAEACCTQCLIPPCLPRLFCIWHCSLKRAADVCSAAMHGYDGPARHRGCTR